MEKLVLLSSYCTGHNFGSLLQCYALKKYIESNNYTVQLVCNKHGKIFSFLSRGILHPRTLYKFYKSKSNTEVTYNEDQNKLFKSFIDKSNILFCSYNKHKKIAHSKETYACVCGSDQIWNSESLFMNKCYFLSYSPYNKNISYAASLGRDYIPNYNKRYFKKLLKNIKYLSIRESQSVEAIKDITEQRHIQVCCDPVLLFNKEEWSKISTKNYDKDYVFCYILDDPQIETISSIISSLNSMNKKVLFVGNVFKKYIDKFNFEYSFISIEVNNFPSYIFDAYQVITDSFHGLAFSIIGRKKVLFFQRNYASGTSQNIRIKSLFDSIGLKKVNDNRLLELNFQDINLQKLDSFISSSKEYLISSLNGVSNE